QGKLMNKFFLVVSISLATLPSFGQVPVPVNDSLQHFPVDTIHAPKDTVLRIINLNPYFTLHVDSILQYRMELNKNPEDYYWYLKNSPIGVRLNKDNGLLTVKVEKSYFFSGK